MTQFALRRAVTALAVSVLLTLPAAAVSLSEDFSSDPFGNWVYGVGSNARTQFVYSASAPAAWTGDAIGQLEVHLDSSSPTVRLERPLGVTLTDRDSFTLTTRFSMSIISAPQDNSLQIAFGLVNSALTGGDRAGSLSTSADTFHTVEFNYFPQISTWSTPSTGPTLTPSVIGAQKGAGSPFDNFAALFGSSSDLSDNTALTSLPQNVVLEAILNYSGLTKNLVLTMNQVAGNGTITLLQTELPSMSLALPPGYSNYDTNFSYSVNALAIMAYRDGWTTPADPSLVADLTFQSFQFITPIPEPSATTLVGATALLVLGARRFRKAAPGSVSVARGVPTTGLRPRTAHSRAFTLVEMLVTIGILALLATLLVPGARTARESARKAQCVSNLRQLGLSVFMYLDDYGRYFPYSEPAGSSDRLWYFGLESPYKANAEPGSRQLDLTRGRLWSYFRTVHGVEVCPSYDYKSPLWRQKFNTATYGYGLNYELFGVPAAEIRSPARTVCMADAANINTIQAPATSTNPMLEEFYYVHNYSNQVPTIHFRHSGRANVLFCDGHVETLAMVEGTEDIRLLSARVGRLASAGDRARFTP